MAHAAQFKFVDQIRNVFPGHFREKRVLEVGSLDINGSVRRFFVGCDYTGIDVAPGPGVDQVCDGQYFDAAPFDVVLSCEAMEHNPHWVETLKNMVRLCKPDGIILTTCASPGRPEHGTTRSQPGDSPLTVGIGWDYYKNLTARDFIESGAVSGLSVRFFVNWISHDLYMIALQRDFSTEEEGRIDAIATYYRRVNLSTFRGLRNRLRAFVQL